MDERIQDPSSDRQRSRDESRDSSLIVSGQEMSRGSVPPQIDRGLEANGQDREYGVPGKGDLGAFSQVTCTFYIAGRCCRYSF